MQPFRPLVEPGGIARVPGEGTHRERVVLALAAGTPASLLGGLLTAINAWSAGSLNDLDWADVRLPFLVVGACAAVLAAIACTATVTATTGRSCSSRSPHPTSAAALTGGYLLTLLARRA